MDVRLIFLGFLMQGGLTGYDLKKCFSVSFSFFSGLSYGTIYPALKKMEQEGLITLKVEIQDGSPNRKVYSITDAGRKAFTEALKSESAAERPKNLFLTKLFFFSHLPHEERMAVVTSHLDSIQRAQKELHAAGPYIEDNADPYQKLCYQFGVRFHEDLVKNISEIVRGLDTIEKQTSKKRGRKSS